MKKQVTRMPGKKQAALPQQAAKRAPNGAQSRGAGMTQSRPLPRGGPRSRVPNRYQSGEPRQSAFKGQFPRGSSANSVSKQQDIVEFDEYIGEVNGSAAFATTKYSLQPGLTATFPEGAVEAALWTEWRMNYCEFYYKPEVSGFATQGQSGKVILSFDYNAANPAPTSKQQVELMHKADGMPYEDICLPLDPLSVNRSDAKYIRTGATPAGADVKTYDGGNLWVSTYGQTNGNVVGELRCRYKFPVFKPTLLNGVSGADPSVALFQSTTPEASGATTVAKNLVLATASANGLGAVNTAGSIVPPSGRYLIDVTNVATATNSMTLSVLNILKNGVSLFQTAPQVSDSTTDISLFLAGMLFASFNGTTDTLTVAVTNTYSVGTVTNSGTLRLLAV
jgi:hypothetical protein